MVELLIAYGVLSVVVPLVTGLFLSKGMNTDTDTDTDTV